MPNMDDIWLDIMHSATGTSDTKSGQNASEAEIFGSSDA